MRGISSIKNKFVRRAATIGFSFFVPPLIIVFALMAAVREVVEIIRDLPEGVRRAWEGD